MCYNLYKVGIDTLGILHNPVREDPVSWKTLWIRPAGYPLWCVDLYEVTLVCDTAKMEFSFQSVMRADNVYN